MNNHTHPARHFFVCGPDARRSVLLVLLLSPVYITLAGALHASPPSSGSSGDDTEQQRMAKVTAFAEADSVQAGETFSVIVRFQMGEGWHIYWKNPGNAGMPTDVRVDGPEGFRTGAIRWPRPVEFKTGKINTFGYKKETMLFVPVTAPDPLPEAPHEFEVSVDYLACKNRCFRQSETLTARLPGDTMNNELKQAVETYRAAIPVSFEQVRDRKVRWTDSGVVLTGRVPSSKTETMTVFPISISGVELGTPEKMVRDGTFRLRIPVSWNPDNHIGDDEPAVRGVLTFGPNRVGPSYEFSIPLRTD